MGTQHLSLADAALRLRLTYHQARALLLRGELKGGRDDMGRYYVEARSVGRYARRRVGRGGRAGLAVAEKEGPHGH